jgi:hypothetical protein
MRQLGDAIKASGFDISLIISGGAVGVDRLGEIYAQLNDIPTLIMNANWKMDGRAAGYMRNNKMAEQADALIAIWNGHSSGTAHMIRIAKAKGLKVYTSQPATKAEATQWDF